MARTILLGLAAFAFAAFLAAAFISTQDHCYFGVCFWSEMTRLYGGLAAVSGLVALIAARGARGGAATGAGMAFLAIAAVVSFWPPIESYVLDQPDDVASRIDQAAKFASSRDYIGPDKETQNSRTEFDVALSKAGIGAVRINTRIDGRIQIDVIGKDGFDPRLQLYREEALSDAELGLIVIGARRMELDSRKRTLVDDNDNGGDETAARLRFEAAKDASYLLIIRPGAREERKSDTLATKAVTIRVDLENRDFVTADRRAVLSLAAAPDAPCAAFGTSAASAASCAAGDFGVIRPGEVGDGDFFKVTIDALSEPACLVVDVTPEGDADTVLGLFDEKRDLIDVNDDRGGGDVIDRGSRLFIPLEPSAEPAVLLPHVTAYGGGEEIRFSIYVEVAPRAQRACEPFTNFARRVVPGG